jgi:hypothetical protein
MADTLKCLKLDDDPSKYLHTTIEHRAEFRRFTREVANLFPGQENITIHPPECNDTRLDMEWIAMRERPELFGPFIPVFVTLGNGGFPGDTGARDFVRMMRPDFIYVAAQTHDNGIFWPNEVGRPRNLFSFAASQGEIPVPQWLCEFEAWNGGFSDEFDFAFAGLTLWRPTRSEMIGDIRRANLSARVQVNQMNCAGGCHLEDRIEHGDLP